MGCVRACVHPNLLQIRVSLPPVIIMPSIIIHSLQFLHRSHEVYQQIFSYHLISFLFVLFSAGKFGRWASALTVRWWPPLVKTCSLISWVLILIWTFLLLSLSDIQCMLWANCKLNQLKNGPPVYKPVIQFVNWLAHFQLYETKWSHLKTRLNILKTGLKAGEWFTSSPNGMKAVQPPGQLETG